MEKLLELLSRVRPDVDFGSETSLIGDGILDSLDIMEIVSEMSDAFGVTLSPADIIPSNFDSAEAMWKMIKAKLG